MEGKKDWAQGAVLVLCAALLGISLWQGRRLRELEQAVWNAQNSVMSEVSRLDGRVASLYSSLESAPDLVRDWDYTAAVDADRRGLDVEVSVLLKEWNENTAVELLWTNQYGDGGGGSVPLSGDGTGRFAGTLELPLSKLSGEYAAEVKIANGETQRRESLGYLGNAAGLLPVQFGSWHASGPSYWRGTVTLSNCTAEIYEPSKAVPEITDAAFRLLRNGETAAERAAKQGYRSGGYECGEELSVECQAGDELVLTFFCRDMQGLGYEFYLNGWEIDGSGIQDAAAPGWNWPKLTWD